jgi:hypothetical protein
MRPARTAEKRLRAVGFASSSPRAHRWYLGCIGPSWNARSCRPASDVAWVVGPRRAQIRSSPRYGEETPTRSLSRASQ